MMSKRGLGGQMAVNEKSYWDIVVRRRGFVAGVEEVEKIVMAVAEIKGCDSLKIIHRPGSRLGSEKVIISYVYTEGRDFRSGRLYPNESARKLESEINKIRKTKEG